MYPSSQQGDEKKSRKKNEDHVLNQAFKKQTSRLKNLFKKLFARRSSIEQVNPDRISSDEKGYYQLLELLEDSYLERSVADLMLSTPPENLEYEHWSALVGALAKKLNLTDGTLRVDPDLSDLIRQGFVRDYDLATEGNLQAIAMASKRYIADQEGGSVALELIDSQLNDNRLLFLLEQFTGIPLRGLNVSENPIQLNDEETVDLFKTFVGSPFVSLTLSEEGLSSESVETLNNSLGVGSAIETIRS